MLVEQSNLLKSSHNKITMKLHPLILLTPALFILAACNGTPPNGGGGGKGKPPSGTDLIAKLDKDGDGLISKQEFDGPDEHFTQSDTNKDGYLSVDEIPSGPPPRK
jgi:hypothetical protein